MLINIMEKTTTNNIGMVITKIKAAFVLIVKAITIAPKTINGLLNNSLKPKFKPF